MIDRRFSPNNPEGGSDTRVTFVDIEANGLIVKELCGTLALTGIIRVEMAMILPDGETTVYSQMDSRDETALMREGIQYVGTMRRKAKGLGRQFSDVPPEGILETDKLVLLDTDRSRTVSRSVTGLQTRWSGYNELIIKKST
jgi:hypothetical protein